MTTEKLEALGNGEVIVDHLKVIGENDPIVAEFWLDADSNLNINSISDGRSWLLKGLYIKDIRYSVLTYDDNDEVCVTPHQKYY